MPTQPNPFSASHEELQPAARASGRGWIVIMLVVGTLVLICAVTITGVLAFVWGAIVGTTDVYHRRAEQQAAEMRVYLGSQGDRFDDLTIEEASNGWSYLSGTVDSQEDFDQLQDEMQRLFGEELGEDMTRNVEVVSKAAD
jgi:hypothetical protein